MAYEEAIKEEVLKAKTEDINELENIKTSIQQTSDVDEKEVKKLNDEVLAKVVDISDQILTNSISNPDEVAIAEEIKDLKNDVDEDLKSVQNSNLSEDEKVKISEKIEDAIVEEAVESINDLSRNQPENKKSQDENKLITVIDEIKENLQNFLEDTDIKRAEIAENTQMENIEKIEEEEQLQEKTKNMIMKDIESINEILHPDVGKSTLLFLTHKYLCSLVLYCAFWSNFCLYSVKQN